MARAYLTSSSLRGAWRARFNIPRTDPRYLDATEEDLVDDLLNLQFYDFARRREYDPAFGLATEISGNLEHYKSTAEKIRLQLEPGGKLHDQLQKYQQKQRPPKTAKLNSIRMSRKKAPPAEGGG